MIITSAERSLSLYQSCYKSLKKQQKLHSKSKPHTTHGASHNIKNVEPPEEDSADNAYTINLELRMAQTLRFLALLHSSTTLSNDMLSTENGVQISNEQQSKEVANSGGSEQKSNKQIIEMAIKYHDMAVSLLVGVFEDDHDNDNPSDDDAANDIKAAPQHDVNGTKELEGYSVSASAEESLSQSQDEDETNGDGRTILTISIPNNDKLNKHTLQNIQPNTPPPQQITSATNNTSSSQQVTTINSTTNVTFQSPTEIQKVRTISTSLNELAKLHILNGNDRAAMDSYREALEILSAATENDTEEEVDSHNEEELDGEPLEEGDLDCYEEKGNNRAAVDASGEYGHGDDTLCYSEEGSRGIDAPPSVASPRQRLKDAIPSSSTTNKSSSSTMSPIQVDLANTLMNVGNFHLRRDELDAALNAYSTVWALYSGKSFDSDGQDAPQTPATPSEAGSASIAYTTTSLPAYLTTPSNNGLTTPQQSHTPKSLSSFTSPTNTNSSQPASYSLGALIALNNLGIVHERRSELQDALSCFEYVFQARSIMVGNEHDSTLDVLINIGNIYQRLSDWTKACSIYEEVAGVFRSKLTRWERSEDRVDEKKDMNIGLKLYRSLAGALRNWGICYWKKFMLSEAISTLNDAVDMEENIVSTFLSPSSSFRGDVATLMRQAKESMAQLLGLLGCICIEFKNDEDKLYEESEDAFRGAIQLYQELGHDASHPSIQWAQHNLTMVEQSQIPPPPPLPASPSPDPPSPGKKDPSSSNQGQRRGFVPAAAAPPKANPSRVISQATPLSTVLKNEKVNETVDLDEIDSVELEQALATDDDSDEDGEDMFSGLEANSTDELDAFLSGDAKDRATPDIEISRPRQNIVDDRQQVEVNRPLSNDHRNISAGLLSDQGSDGQQHEDDDELEERLSQLQLQAESNEGDDIEAARANVALAEVFWSKGDRVTATDHYTEAHTIFANLGEVGQQAVILKKLGDLNMEDDKPDAAKELYQEALELEIEIYGQYLPQTLNAAGQMCLQKEDFRSSMEFHRRALLILKKGGSEDDKHEIYETLVRIGNVYYSERNNLSNIRSNGVDYREFIESGFLGWIANAHDQRGEYIKAIQFYEESLHSKGKETKREMALTLNRLGSLTRELGRYDEAMGYHQRALKIQRSSSSVAKAMTAETCVLMGMVKAKNGEFTMAINLYEDALLVLRSALGENHLSVSKTMTQIGSVYYELSNYKQAMSILLEAEQLQLASVGEKNRDLLETQALIGRVLSANGRCEEAIEKLGNVLERQHKLFASKHPTIADTLSYIGDCFLDQGLNTEARAEFVKCYNMRKEFFTVDMYHIALSMVNIIRVRQGQPDRALAIYKNALDVYKEYLSDDHVIFGRLHVYEGDSYSELLNFSKAIEQYEKAKKIFHKVFGGECSADSAMVACRQGLTFLRKCDYDSAKACFTFALNIYQTILPEGHKMIIDTLASLDRVEKEESLCV